LGSIGQARALLDKDIKAMTIGFGDNVRRPERRNGAAALGFAIPVLVDPAPSPLTSLYRSAIYIGVGAIVHPGSPWAPR
jgi:hypothetical protein